MGKTKGVSSKTHFRGQCNHYANQNNKNNKAYKSRMDNHSNQKNNNNKINLCKSEYQPSMWPGFLNN